MRFVLLSALFLTFNLLHSTSINAQTFPQSDISPMDMAYFPGEAPFYYFSKDDTERKQRQKKLRVIYSRPSVKGRKIFGDLIPYGKLWRMGANESTELDLFTDVKIGGKKLKAGSRYTIHVIPHIDNWMVYISNELDGWGSFNLVNNPEKTTVTKIKVPITKSNDIIKTLGIYFEATKEGCEMVIGWENTVARIPITIL